MTGPLNPRPSETVFTAVTSDAGTLELRACYFPSPLDLGRLQAHYPPAQVLCGDPLVLGLAGGAYVAVLHFGAVVFWQCSLVVCGQVLDDVRQVLQLQPAKSEDQDTLEVLLNQPQEGVTFRNICLQALTLEHIRIISATFGQSIALRECERSVTQALRNTGPIVQALEARGELKPSGKTILKTVGFTLSVRDVVLSKLSLFDDPSDARQSERLSRLHQMLADHFGVRKRLSALHEKVTYLSDVNQTLMSLLQNRTSHQLEWVVILLIVFEVILSVVHYVWPAH